MLETWRPEKGLGRKGLMEFTRIEKSKIEFIFLFIYFEKIEQIYVPVCFKRIALFLINI